MNKTEIKINNTKEETLKTKYFYGDLVQNKDLNKIAKQRKKKYKELTAPKELQNSYLKSGWKVKRKFKKGIRLWKEKECGELLEDRVWLLFKNMGFGEMNKDRHFKIQAGPIKKQIDVFAKDDNNIFIIECKALAEKGSRSLRQDIHEVLNLKKDLIEAIRKKYKKNFRFSFLLVTKNIRWGSSEKRLAITNRKKSFFFWDESELQVFIDLVNQLGECAKFVMFSRLFEKRKIRELKKIKVPAIYGGKGNNKYYCFIIQPEKLLPVACVHRREESDPQEIRGTYQRMVRKNRLMKIRNFIDNGGYFPNSITLSFIQKPKFDRKDKVGNIVYGILTFPPCYGSVWIIDGQHRLYGYSESKEKLKANLPVIAFEELSIEKQAKLFVEINKEQKRINPNLLWDLYPDIYRNSLNPKQQRLRIISLIVKELNSDKNSPLYKRIEIPSIPKEKQKSANLTLRTLCTGIQENRLINKEEGLLFNIDYERTVGFACSRLKEYFSIIAKSFPQDWEKGDGGLLCTNIGFRIFLNIFRQLLKYFNFLGIEKTYMKKDLNEFRIKSQEILSPIFVKLRKMPIEKRAEIRGESNKKLIMKNTQRLVWDLREAINFGLELWHNGGWNPEIPKEENNDRIIESLIDDTEIKVRSFIIRELKKCHGKLWWKKGIPEGVRSYIKKIIKKDISKSPYRKKELLSSSLEKNLTKISTSHLKEIIINKNNWERFEETFAKDKDIVSVAFIFFETLRNKYKHSGRRKELTEIERGLGYWNMKWIRRCIGLKKENSQWLLQLKN